MAVNGTSNSTTSATAYSYLQYKNKISGLVSGMDIDSIMEKLMKAESAQMEKLQQQKQKYEWRRDAYREVNTKLSTFETNAFTDYGLKSSWNAKNVTVSNDAVSAVATSAASGTINITEAELSTAAQSVLTMSNGYTADSTIADLGLSDGSFKLKAVDDKGEYIEKEISYTSKDKISDIMSRISSSGVGITAIVSNDKLSLTANIEGEGNETDGAMNVTKDDNGLFQKLGVLATQTGNIVANNGLGNQGNLVTGSNGYIVANGVRIEGTSNKYNISGYQVTINKNIIESDPPSKISSTTDVDKIVDKVKDFVDKYNTLIADINTRTTEKKKVGYDPLTDAQKAEMTDAEIEKWETAAKSGLLKGDSTLDTVLSDMRTTLSTYGSDTNGSKNMLFKIGITTSKDWTEGGKLEIDETKLREALEEDPDIVSRIFTDDNSTGTEGVISKLRTSAQDAVKTIEKSAGKDTSTDETSYSLGKTIADYTTKIDDWKDRLKDIEERYWNQFSAMEQAIQKANSQSSIFSSGSY